MKCGLKYGQLIEYTMKNMEKLATDSFIKKSKLSISLDWEGETL